MKILNKQWVLHIIMKFFYIDGYCKICGCKLDHDYYGEKKGSRWVKWCHSCYKEKFIHQVASKPMFLEKYYKIHGKHPKDIIQH